MSLCQRGEADGAYACILLGDLTSVHGRYYLHGAETLLAGSKETGFPERPFIVPDESYKIRVDKKSFDVITIGIAGPISMENADGVLRDLLQIVENDSLRDVVIDLGEVTYCDSSGITVLLDLGQTCRRHKNSFKITNIPSKMKILLGELDLHTDDTECVLKPKPKPNLIIRVGDWIEHLPHRCRESLEFIGAALDGLIRDLRRPSRARWDSLTRLLERCGTDATPIVVLLGFLMGGIMAFQAAIQLRKFGANIFVADLVGLSIVLEMGPLLTCLIVAGRSGAAFAAQIGTMRVTEEIEALSVMGIDPMRYLVSPRIVALALSVPCLTLLADVAGILGGCLVAGFSLDITPTGYFNQLHKVLEVTDVAKGLTKSFVFGLEIAVIGCLRGFQVRGGAEMVGLATTSAVVTSIFVITCTDAVFSVLYYYGPSIWK